MSTAGQGSSDKKTANQLKKMREKFEAAMNDDLNTSVALSVLFELVRLTQVLLEDSNTNVGTLNLVDVLFDRLGGDVLGIVKDEYPQAGAAGEQVMDKLVDVVIQQRNQARANKDFAKADELRARLDEIGIVLEDKQDVTTWRTK
ncbi:MAG: DALR domain-containing protein [Planctomycetota bacterium]|jgi:cysteinyl-tRNA synthetase